MGPLCRALPTTRNGRTLVSADHLLYPFLPIEGVRGFYFFWTVKRPWRSPEARPLSVGCDPAWGRAKGPRPHQATQSRERRRGARPGAEAAGGKAARGPPAAKGRPGPAARGERPPGPHASAPRRPRGEPDRRGQAGARSRARPRACRTAARAKGDQRPRREPPKPPGRTDLPRTPDGRQGGTGGRPGAQASGGRATRPAHRAGLRKRTGRRATEPGQPETEEPDTRPGQVRYLFRALPKRSEAKRGAQTPAGSGGILPPALMARPPFPSYSRCGIVREPDRCRQPHSRRRNTGEIPHPGCPDPGEKRFQSTVVNRANVYGISGVEPDSLPIVILQIPSVYAVVVFKSPAEKLLLHFRSSFVSIGWARGPDDWKGGVLADPPRSKAPVVSVGVEESRTRAVCFARAVLESV